LYPQLLNLYGDRGNLLALTKRLVWRGIDFEISEIGLGDNDIKFSDHDLFFIGGGQDSQQDLVAKDLKLRKKELVDILETGAVMLAICGGYQLLGHSYQTSDGNDIEGLGIMDIVSQAKPREHSKQERLIGNVVAELLLEGLQSKTLVGFENHSGRTYINARSQETKALARIVKGFGNNGEDAFEGAIYKNIFGTYLHGSLLPKNPHFADELILRALKYSHQMDSETLVLLDDKLEYLAHQAALQL
jgi:lipid II isoglutaminyl synthase (glutamine-hydrolysing)